MPRSRSSYTESPTRYRSPQRSPARRGSEDGSQYELDLDALGMNSTFESTELDASRDLNADVVDTSDIEGPEDFTMNMTYWMTADLPLAQMKSRKEASARVQEVRGDTNSEADGGQDTIEVEDGAVLEESLRSRQGQKSNSASPTMRANSNPDGRQSHNASSESSMGNEEKVISYLDALPDTDVVTSTPLRVQKRDMLQVPKLSAPKARSLQPTVEDYDTPRKPTQSTVIHHIQDSTEPMGSTEQESVSSQIAELQARLLQQELASMTRIAELETILSFTRSELETARTANYKQKEKTADLEREIEKKRANHQGTEPSVESQLKKKEEELSFRMREFGEELRLQNLAKLQSQREGFEQQLRAAEEAKRVVNERAEASDRHSEQLRSELDKSKLSREQELQTVKTAHLDEQQNHEQNFNQERKALNEKLSAFQARADTLQADLEKATAAAKAAREEVQATAPLHKPTSSSSQANASRIIDLESRIKSLESQLHASRTDVATKDQELLRISDLESRIQLLQSQLDSSRAEVTIRDQELGRNSCLESQVQSLQSQLDSSRANLTAKEQDLLHKSDLQSRIQTLQSELDASRAEGIVKDQELQRKSDQEARIQSLQTQLASARNDLASKDQYLLSNIEEQERLEQVLNTGRGRIEGLETTVSNLRQQIAEAYRQSSKSRTDIERYEKDLEDATDRIKDARAEADRKFVDMERKLSKMKELKTEAETRCKNLISSHERLVEDHETQLENVRCNAEDAVHKAGALIEHERSEKKRLTKELKSKMLELETARSETARKNADEQVSSDEDEDAHSSAPSPHAEANAQAKNTEIENLRTLVRNQASAMKTLKSETTALCKAYAKSQAQAQAQSKTEEDESDAITLQTLHAELHTLRHENALLRSQAAAREDDFAVVNKAMDERLAAMLSTVLKERAKSAVGKRDGQWVESLGKKQSERELMGKVLMREWGRQEVGVPREEEGERQKQGYRYKYVKRT